MKLKVAIAGLALLASQAAFATTDPVEQKLIDWGFVAEPMEGTRFIRVTHAEPVNESERLAVEWELVSPRVAAITPVRVVHEQHPPITDPVERTLVEWGFKSGPMNFRSEAAGEPVEIAGR